MLDTRAVWVWYSSCYPSVEVVIVTEMVAMVMFSQSVPDV